MDSIMILDKANHIGARHRFQLSYNCWAFTLMMIDRLDFPTWINPYTINEYLRSMDEVFFDDVQPGDIIAYYDDDSEVITHTAIYLGNDEVIHKPGAFSICVDHAFHNSYATHATIRYFRPQGDNHERCDEGMSTRHA